MEAKGGSGVGKEGVFKCRSDNYQVANEKGVGRGMNRMRVRWVHRERVF
jgi:hypothetical protein